MTEKLELYKCNICGNLTQIILPGIGELVCCGESMKKLIAKYDENNELAEKHIPIIEKEKNKIVVKLNHHPMIEEHYIQFIEVCTKDKSKLYLKYLNPNEIAEFKLQENEENINALEYCNIHGLWRNNND